MEWTSEKIAELQRMAESGVNLKDMGSALGCSHETVRVEAICRGIARNRFKPPVVKPHDQASLRSRWAVLIGPMKEQIRSEIAGVHSERVERTPLLSHGTEDPDAWARSLGWESYRERQDTIARNVEREDASTWC